MIFDLAVSEKVDLTDTNERIVIVGAGPVGIYLAYCLLKARQSVILIEAGARIAELVPQLDRDPIGRTRVRRS